MNVDPNSRISSYNNSDPPAQAKKGSPLLAKMAKVAAGVFSRVGEGLGKVQGKVNVVANGAEKIGDSLQGFTRGVVKLYKESADNKRIAGRAIREQKDGKEYKARNEKMQEGLSGLESKINGLKSLAGADKAKIPGLIKQYENEFNELKKEKIELDDHPGRPSVVLEDMKEQFDRLEAAIKNLKAKLGNP